MRVSKNQIEQFKFSLLLGAIAIAVFMLIHFLKQLAHA